MQPQSYIHTCNRGLSDRCCPPERTAVSPGVAKPVPFPAGILSKLELSQTLHTVQVSFHNVSLHVHDTQSCLDGRCSFASISCQGHAVLRRRYPSISCACLSGSLIHMRVGSYSSSLPASVCRARCLSRIDAMHARQRRRGQAGAAGSCGASGFPLRCRSTSAPRPNMGQHIRSQSTGSLELPLSHLCTCGFSGACLCMTPRCWCRVQSPGLRCSTSSSSGCPCSLASHLRYTRSPPRYCS